MLKFNVPTSADQWAKWSRGTADVYLRQAFICLPKNYYLTSELLSILNSFSAFAHYGSKQYNFDYVNF